MSTKVEDLQKTGARRRKALGIALMTGATLFWSAVFAALAGAETLAKSGGLARLAESAVCPLLALILGVDALNRGLLRAGGTWGKNREGGRARQTVKGERSRLRNSVGGAL